MRFTPGAALVSSLVLLTTACHQPSDTQVTDRGQTPAASVTGLVHGGSPNAGTPTPGVSGPAAPPHPAPHAALDPASPDAARQAIARYYDAIARKQPEQAQAMWAPGPMKAEELALFAARFAGEQDVKISIGQPQPPEGAAGSTYISVPVVVRGVPSLTPREPYVLERLVTLRRVNDVPGSSAADRQWHIFAIRDASKDEDDAPAANASPIAF